MIIIQSAPYKPHTENSIRISWWNCSRHPMLFTFWRIDMVIGAMAAMTSGKTAIQFALTQTAALELNEGDTVFVKTADGLYNTTGTLTYVDTSNGSFYYIETDIDWVGAPVGGGYVNNLSRSGYYVEAEILGTDPVSGTQRVWGTARVSTNNEGFARLDASGYLHGYVDKVNGYDYTTKNVIDPYVFGSFVLRYTGKWVNGSESTTYTDTNRVWFVDAVKNLLSKYGQNLCDYLPFNDSTLTEKAKFLCDFERPTYFQGYPFDLSVIVPDFVGNSVGATANEERHLVDGTVDGTSDTALIQYKENAVQRVKLVESYATDITDIDFWLNAGDLAQEDYIESGYIDSNYFESIGAVAVSPFRFTEIKNIKVVNPCDDSPIYLAWRNSKGGWSYWLFTKFQEHNIGSKVSGVVGQEPDDLETAMHREITTSIRQSEKITVGGVVKIEDISGLRYLESSPRVQMLISQSPLTWLTVQMAPKGIKYRTDGNNIDVEFDILLPETYTIPN